VDGVVYFVQRGGESFRQFLFVDNEKAYSTDIVSLFSSHLILNPQDAAFKKSLSTEDGNYIWLVNSDGSLAAFSILRSELINAWSLLTTDGDFMHVSVLDQDTYFHVKREIGLDNSISYSGDSFDLTGQESDPTHMTFSSDGLKLFVVGGNSDSVHEYDLVTAFDFTDGVLFSGNSFSVATQTVLPTGVVFNDIGTKMFVVGSDNNEIYEYSLTTPFSLASGVTYSGNSFVPTPELTSTRTFSFNDDGTKMFITGTIADTLFEYTLSVAYDFSSTIAYTGNSFNYSAEDGFVMGVSFNFDGTIMYLFGNVNNSVFKYTLSTGFDLSSTVTYTSESFLVSGQDLNGRGVVIAGDGLRMWILGDTAQAAFQYDLSPANSLLPGVTDSGNSFSILGQTTTPTGLRWNDDGTKFYICEETTSLIFEYTVSVAFDLSSTVAFSGNSVDLSSEETLLQGFSFNSDGTKIFAVGATNATVYEYTLSVGFDLSSTFTYTGNSFSVSSEETGPRFVIWNGDGTQFYIAGDINDTIFEYTVSIAYDLSSTVAYSGNSLVISGEVTVPRQMDFNSTGLKFFIIDGGSDTVYEYTCSTAYSMVGAAYSGFSHNVTTIENTPTCMGMSNDGLKMVICGFANNTVFELDLNVAFSLAADIVYSGEFFAFGGQDISFTGMAFNDDGTKVFMVGDLNDSVFEYNLVTPYDLSGGVFYSGNSFIIESHPRETNILSAKREEFT